MNQIEIWFGTLRKKLNEMAECRSLNVLRESVLTFIDYYNTNHWHPYNWTYTLAAFSRPPETEMAT
jgi:hypothetical protein